MGQDQPEKTEKTPKGMTVPVPKRGAFFGNLKKAAKADPEKPTPAKPAEK